MALKIYQCNCGNEFASNQVPNSTKIKDRPQCGKCGQRVR